MSTLSQVSLNYLRQQGWLSSSHTSHWLISTCDLNSQAHPDLCTDLSFIPTMLISEHRKCRCYRIIEVSTQIKKESLGRPGNVYQFWGCLQTVPSRGIYKNFSDCYLVTKTSVTFLCHTLPAVMD